MENQEIVNKKQLRIYRRNPYSGSEIGSNNKYNCNEIKTRIYIRFCGFAYGPPVKPVNLNLLKTATQLAKDKERVTIYYNVKHANSIRVDIDGIIETWQVIPGTFIKKLNHK